MPERRTPASNCPPEQSQPLPLPERPDRKLAQTGIIAEAGFEPSDNPPGFGPLWSTRRIDSDEMSGAFHMCSPTGEWTVSVLDLSLAHDTVLAFDLPECISLAWLKSVSGEQLDPYRRVRARSLRGHCGKGSWRGVVHGGVPVKAVALEVSPEFARACLESWPTEGSPSGIVSANSTAGIASMDDIAEAIASLGEPSGEAPKFPEMRSLLLDLRPRPGHESHDARFYEGKVSEAMGLLAKRALQRRQQPPQPQEEEPAARNVSPDDELRIRDIARFIDDNCASELCLADLARAACMGTTKFKVCFKAVTGSTLVHYIQARRVSQAASLLRQSDIPIEQITRIVGYTCASRFVEVFRRETGMLPREYRTR